MTLSHEIQEVYNGPDAGFFMLPLPNTEIRHYLDWYKTISKLNFYLQTTQLQDRSCWDVGLLSPGLDGG